MNRRRCPSCGSVCIGRAVYGSLEQPGDVFYAGCVIGPEDPRRYGCHDCGALFDRPLSGQPASAAAAHDNESDAAHPGHV
ncbi:hypothetical protein [Humibacter sp.]|jgi:hypothetical protein|uniref:hypothetical protein n=1 Tax=Humibacter sp. TaxID=1940291 RepID=UPI002B6BACDB|nr:hypothetical protein [Humibacter sp.]HVX07214.1 hypothetical protein [Humibacter sp.]